MQSSHDQPSESVLRTHCCCLEQPLGISSTDNQNVTALQLVAAPSTEAEYPGIDWAFVDKERHRPI